MKKIFVLVFSLLACISLAGREKFNFNPDWLLKVGDIPGAEKTAFKDASWQKVTLPHAFNEDEAFKLDIHNLTDTVMWYRKHFVLPQTAKGKKVFIEFEGARQAIEVWVNGKKVGMHENGVMAFGYDLTPYVKTGSNVIAARIDNDWDYKEKSSGVKFQWSDRNFNANYGGLPKNVWLHITDKLYQTLPLYSTLHTTGVYVYAADIRVKARSATIHAESEVKNETGKPQNVEYRVSITAPDGTQVAAFSSEAVELAAGQTATLSAEAPVEGLHFWSWGYGYLYDVKTTLVVDGREVDTVNTRTGFRKTRFSEGKIWLNDRVLQMKGYAQRTSNEWPAVGLSVPAWMSDYSNGLMVEGNANVVRWMHVTPWKQDIESCDRVGLAMSMQAGDAEKDITGPQWEQRKALMTDAIIYNRNNPSILFYECGNKGISREHFLEMREIRDKYDFYGGRAIGSREMLDIRESEYGGEMLYINKSAHTPFWAQEYCRDEALRKYWDDWSYPFHKEGEGNNMVWSAASNSYIPAGSGAYNHNQDNFVVEHVARWYDYFRERPGSGTRVSSGGVKIIFSDSNTHFRGVENYRRSGVTDALRIPKDSYWAHQVMWDGWVDIEKPRIYIVGHWNYEAGTVKPVYVVSNTETVDLFLNGKKLENGVQSNQFLFTYSDVKFAEGKLEAVGYNGGKAVAGYTLETAGKPAAIKLTKIMDPAGWRADGADLALVQIEVVDAQGRRCPLANDIIHYELNGPAEWRGGLAQGPDNYILSKDFPVECGVNRAIIRSTTTAGTVTLKASAEGLKGAEVTMQTVPFESKGGLSTYVQADYLPGRLDRGETPQTPSYTDFCVDAPIVGATAPVNAADVANSYDDNEETGWSNDGTIENAWITYHLGRMAQVDEICVKMSDWRSREYPLQIFAGDELCYEGALPRTLGYAHINLKPVMARDITVRLKNAAEDNDAFSQVVELADEQNGNRPAARRQANMNLKIIEIEFKENLLQ